MNTIPNCSSHFNAISMGESVTSHTTPSYSACLYNEHKKQLGAMLKGGHKHGR